MRLFQAIIPKHLNTNFVQKKAKKSIKRKGGATKGSQKTEWCPAPIPALAKSRQVGIISRVDASIMRQLVLRDIRSFSYNTNTV